MPVFKHDLVDVFSHDFPLTDVVSELREVRRQWRTKQNRLSEYGGRRLPSPNVLNEAVQLMLGALFPMRLGPDDLLLENEDFYICYTIAKSLELILGQVQTELWYQNRGKGLAYESFYEQAVQIVRSFASSLPSLRTKLDLDVMAAYYGDPAARSVDEVLLCYPGLQAMIYYRIAHELFKLKAPLVARIIAETSHSLTGIDIHPGAQIDEGFFIDHGTGVVIGETCIIGKNVRLYQAVTLGAKSFSLDSDGHPQKNVLRHPIVEDDVIIYAGATILGRVTVGKGSVIGGNVWLTQSVTPGSVITQANMNKCKSEDEL